MNKVVQKALQTALFNAEGNERDTMDIEVSEVKQPSWPDRSENYAIVCFLETTSTRYRLNGTIEKVYVRIDLDSSREQVSVFSLWCEFLTDGSEGNFESSRYEVTEYFYKWEDLLISVLVSEWKSVMAGRKEVQVLSAQ